MVASPGSLSRSSGTPKARANVVGPQALLRHAGGGRLELQEEGLSLLRRAEAPVHVAFTVGGSRCGKSTTGNALLFGEDGVGGAALAAAAGAGAAAAGGGESPCNSGGTGAGFATGCSFEPVTTGVDVAVRLLPGGGGSLVVADCEGAFHACGSAQSARGFGALGFLAYHLSSTLIHVSMGSIDERDIEVLGHLAASVEQPQHFAGSAGKVSDDRPAFPAPVQAPALVLLVNGARFDLGDAVARRLLQPPEAVDHGAATRGCSRVAIARTFRGQPALEALPACEHAAYWPKVGAIRKRILEAPASLLHSGVQACGEDLADRLMALVQALNGDIDDEGKPLAGSPRMEPEPAAEAVYRSAHLEPLVEEIARRFAREAPTAVGGPADAQAAGGEGSMPISPASRGAKNALAEFDRRAAWLVSGGKGDVAGTDANSQDDKVSPGSATAKPVVLFGVRPGLVAEARVQLESRLSGINEAMARGRQQAATVRRPASRGSGTGRRRPSSASSLPPAASAPDPAEGGAEGSFVALELQMSELEERLDGRQDHLAEEVGVLQSACCDLYTSMKTFHEQTEEANRKELVAIGELQERWSQRIQGAADDHARYISSQIASSSKELGAIQGELRDIVQKLPDVGLMSAELHQVREGMDAERLALRQVEDLSAQALETQVVELRRDSSAEASALEALREGSGRRFAQVAQELHAELQDVRHDREERYQALEEVVHRMRHSLAVTFDEVADLSPDSLAPKSRSAMKPLAPEALPSSLPALEPSPPQAHRKAAQMPSKIAHNLASPLQGHRTEPVTLPAAPVSLPGTSAVEKGPKRATGFLAKTGSRDNSPGSSFIGK